MESTAVARRRPGRRWLLVLVPLAMVAFVWWWMTRQSPLPKFVDQFEDRILYRGHFRSDVVSPKSFTTVIAHSRVTNLFIEAPPELVLQVMLDEFGNDSVWLVGGGVTYGAHKSNGDPSMMCLMGATYRGRKGTDLVIASRPESVTAVDQLIASVWPRWFETKFGESFTRPQHLRVDKPDSALRGAAINGLRKDHLPRAQKSVK